MKEYKILFNNNELLPVHVMAETYQFEQKNSSDILEFWIDDEIVAVFLTLDVCGFVLVDRDYKEDCCCTEANEEGG